MYITRAEWFIYIAPILFIVTVIHIMRRKELWEFLGGTILLFFGFFILAFPYMVHLHTITGEWWLTNKWSSNIRQAMMRWVEEMDDAGFERAVGELTDDKKSLKSWFVWGLKYEKSTGEYSLKTLIMDDPQKFFNTWKQNVGKLVVEILPKMIIGDFIKTYQDPNFKFKRYTVIYYLLFIPLFFTFYGFALMYIDKRRFIIFVFVPLFLTASAFFTLFFVLERYFIPFLPLLLVFMVYGMQWLWRKLTSLQVLRALFFAMMTLCISLLWIHYFINNMSIEKYTVKKVAGERISEHMDTEFPGRTSLRIMERFPIVTYYSGNWERWIVPYANQADIITYAKYNNIDLLVVDSLDFARYRPTLSFLLDEKSILKNPVFEPIYVSQKFWEKVILYKIK